MFGLLQSTHLAFAFCLLRKIRITNHVAAHRSKLSPSQIAQYRRRAVRDFCPR